MREISRQEEQHYVRPLPKSGTVKELLLQLLQPKRWKQISSMRNVMQRGMQSFLPKKTKHWQTSKGRKSKRRPFGSWRGRHPGHRGSIPYARVFGITCSKLVLGLQQAEDRW